MKLNYKRTILVGFAFFLICAFWQAYDNTIPLILTNKFGMSQTWSGIFMAADNVLALFMLPLFGAISDKCSHKKGRRTPFIVMGTLIAAVALICLSFIDNAQLKHLGDAARIDDPAALSAIYESQADEQLITPHGEKFVLSEKFTEEEFTAIRSQLTDESGKTVTNPDYTNYVTPARQAYAWHVTAAHPATLVFFIAVLLVILVAMATFRSPAVALMPDVTMKPLRSKANAVINLMGSAGGILVLALGMAFATASVHNALMSYTAYFAVIAAIMLAALVIFILTVREVEWAQQMQRDSVEYGVEDTAEDGASPQEERKLTRGEVKSLIFILLSIVLWFFGYNAVTSKYSVYASNILHKDYNLTLIIAQAADERHVRSGGHRVGHHQRELLPHGGGAVQRRQRGQVHRLLLHRLHGGAGGHPHAVRPFDGQVGYAGAVPLCNGVRGAGLCHHADGAPRRQQAPDEAGAGSITRFGDGLI